MFMFARIAEQLRQLEQELCSIQLSMGDLSTRTCGNRFLSTHTEAQLQQSVLELRDSIEKLDLVNDMYSQLHEARPLESVIELAMELVWQKAPVSFAVLILGEAELGPYHYYGMKGIQDSWRYIKKECAFTLSGILARALLQRLDPNEPDYLHIPDIKAYGRPLPDEFPWMFHAGSLLIIPLRAEKLAMGALLLGHSQTHQFDELLLRDEYVDIASSLASAIRNAQMRQEMAKNVEQLINVQLLTREITHAQQYQDITDILTKKIPEVIGKVEVQVFMQHPAQQGSAAKFIADMPASAAQPGPMTWHNGTDNSTAMLNGSAYHTLFSAVPLENMQSTDSKLSPRQDPLDAVAPEIRQLFQWTMESSEPVFYDSENLSENPEHPYYSDSGRALIVPIIGHSGTYGVIHIVSLSPLRRFEESDMVVLRTIANTAATAISSVALIHTREQAEIDAIYKMICASEAPVQGSSCHSQRVVHNAVLLAQHMGLPPEETYLIGCGAALHHLSILASGMPEEEKRIQAPLRFVPCPTVTPHVLNSFAINPRIIHMLTLANTSYLEHRHQCANRAGSTKSDESHHLYQPPYPHADSGRGPSPFPVAQPDTSRAQRANETSFALTHFDSVQIGACILHMIDAIDHTYTDAVTQECDAPAKLLSYLDANTGTLFEPTMVEVAKNLLGQHLFLLPTGAPRQDPTAATTPA